jgi:hypothetical protein
MRCSSSLQELSLGAGAVPLPAAASGTARHLVSLFVTLSPVSLFSCLSVSMFARAFGPFMTQRALSKARMSNVPYVSLFANPARHPQRAYFARLAALYTRERYSAIELLSLFGRL